MTAITTRPNLADLPGMDDIEIGPAGETFGQLKQRVRDARAALERNWTEETVGTLNDATSMLRAAYTRVGLRYRAP